MCSLSINLPIFLRYSRQHKFFQKTFQQDVITKNLQSFTSSYSTVSATKLEQISKTQLDFEKIGTSRQKIEVEGMMINWDKVGHGEHAVLLLPGTFGTIESDFKPMFQKMDKDKYTIVSWDPPGYGKSRPPSLDFCRGFQRKDGYVAIKLMEQLGFDKFSIMGWSTGGTTGILMAADYPSKVKRLITMGAFAYADSKLVNIGKSQSNLINKRLDYDFQCLSDLMNVLCVDLKDLDNWHPTMLAQALTIYDKDYLVQMLQNWHQCLCDMCFNNGHAHIIESVPKVVCPTLIFHGQQDLVPGIKHAKFLKYQIPNSKMHLMPKGAHNMHLRYTDEFLDVATRFLES